MFFSSFSAGNSSNGRRRGPVLVNDRRNSTLHERAHLFHHREFCGRRRRCRTRSRRVPSPSRRSQKASGFRLCSRTPEGQVRRCSSAPSARATARTEGVVAQYLLMIGATLRSMNARTCFTTASSVGAEEGAERGVDACHLHRDEAKKLLASASAAVPLKAKSADVLQLLQRGQQLERKASWPS